jgi:glutathione synthase/RimK-type ligase-like ATP-grasp enzyme
MKIGLCNRTAEGWLNEFKVACDQLKHSYEVIEIGDDDWITRLEGVDIFVWRLIMSDVSCMAEARTKIPLIEEMGITCFPSAKMLWLYDDKIRETFFFRQNRIPTPRTWVFFEEESARSFVAAATYPLVAKSHCGASSSGVEIFRTRTETEAFLDRMFTKASLWGKVAERLYFLPGRRKGDLLMSLQGRYRKAWPRYAYFQEFVQTNEDWRITTLGHDLVSVFVRRNRPDDFRASGSGLWKKVTAEEVPQEACDLALEISNRHGFTSMTYDFMRHHSGWVIGEISYAFLLNAVYTETLFRKEGTGYRQISPIPIGVMHLQAIAASRMRQD